MADAGGIPFGGFRSGHRRSRSYEALRTPLDLRNAIVRARLREEGIDPDRLAEMTPTQQAQTLSQVEQLSRYRDEMRDAARRRLTEDWRVMQEERRLSANDTAGREPVAVAATDIARVLLGAEFSGASAAFLQYAQTYYMETYTTAMGDTFRTTQERARLYRDLEDAYADSPEDRGRIGGIVRRAEDFFRRTDDAEQNRRPLTPEEIRRGVRVGVETNEEIRRITARIARIQERIDRGEDPRTVISQAGPEVQNYFRRANGLHALSSEILRRLPNDTPEALARREAVARQLRDLDQRWRGARANPAQRAAVLREFRRVLDATNVENEQQLMARLDTMAERAEHNPAWQARVQERNALQTRIRELAAQVDRDGEDGERATEALRAIVRDLERRTEGARARLPDAQALARQIAAGQDVEMRVLWQRRGLREDTELLRSARLALGEPEAPRAPGGPTTARTTTSETTAGAAAATEPAAARPQTAHQPSAEDPMP